MSYKLRAKLQTIVNDDPVYDLAIVGGGLAGLSLSIQIARKGYKVILFEKEQYPFHRVCGEYISLESWDFLQSLGVDLDALNVSRISKLRVSSINGKLLEQALPLGGFGISRYKLDHVLAQIARSAGVRIQEETKVNDTSFTGEEFTIHSSKGDFRAKLAAGSFGKRSNLDIKWKRPFIMAKKNKLNNYIGVKYHIRSGYPVDTIALHNFKNGYCGIVKVEDDLYCLCYLTTAANLQQSGGHMKQMEQDILCKNPHLQKIWRESDMLWDEPVSISQISFDRKSQVEDHVLMIGDAAGMITPLCGNGMSMALHASKIATEEILLFLWGGSTQKILELQYTQRWQEQFASRLKMGRRIQRLFTNNWLTNLTIALAKPFPGIARSLIKRTHGKRF